MPVRKIPINRRVITGHHALKRLRCSIPFESLLERDYLTLLDFDRDVAGVEGQPVRVPWADERARAHRYTPDFLVTFLPGEEQVPPHQAHKARPWLVEVKDEITLRENWSDLRPRFRAATRFARERGWTFHLRTERRIRTARLANARLLLPAMTLPEDVSRCDALLRVLDGRCTLTPTELVTLACCDPGDEAGLRNMVWRLVAWGGIGADLDHPLSMETLLWGRANGQHASRLARSF